MAKIGDSSFDQREQIRDAIDIVDLVERYVPLRRQGANFVGRCPWHDDSRPSLQVNAQRQTFKCWVCNIGGDVFSFIMKIENVDFKEALQILADMAGIELKKFPKKSRRKSLPAPRSASESNDQTIVSADFDPNATMEEASLLALEDGNEPILPVGSAAAPRYVPVEIDKPTLFRSLEWLAGKYRQTFLHSPEAADAREYLRSRGIDENSSEKFQIGWSPLDYDEVLRWIGYDRNRVRILEAAGVLAYREEYDERGRTKPRPRYEQTPLLCEAERRRYNDRFRGRLIFPIRDVQDRVVAFGGRLTPNSPLKSPAKYVNSPETPIFVKSKMVYGLDQARLAIRKTGKVLITEGYTDCIVASQFGFENVVAVLGTALGAEHVRILKRFAERMILLLDGDEAGQKRTNEVLRFFVEQGVDMRTLMLPNNEDPCEYLLENGAEAFANLLETETVDALDRAFQTATKGIDLDNDLVDSAKALDSLLDIVALFPENAKSSTDPARLRAIKTVQRLSTLFRVDEGELRRQLAEKRARAKTYGAKNEERERRYEERRAEWKAEQEDAPLLSQRTPEEIAEEEERARIEAYRREYVYPVAGEDDESDEELRERFPPFPAFLWNDRRAAPSALEREYLEVWLTRPDLYPTLVAKLPVEVLRSPIARQLDFLARDFLERGKEPSFEQIILRYEDETMKSFLIGLDESANDKGLAKVLANDGTRAILLRDVFLGFERARVEREEPKKLSALRETESSPEEKLQTLLEIRRMQQEKQKNCIGRSAFLEYDSIDSEG